MDKKRWADPGGLDRCILRAVSEQNSRAVPAVLASGMSNPFRYFNSSPEVIRLVVMMYVRYPLSLRNVEDLLAERGRLSAVALALG
jgi:hypothetical protein